ncbi:menaquinone biosynthesis protein, putative [Perkinsus marinus ATCC 50983]|uniref:Menaquinone biosynthesis protein, putative n=1 Tax=Perkinsus marinus (strain ATCC 50983 / TXsc) TaxID=423536 RepID=C5LD40_PERM5|nr:menaquinone biosynthesis protein, putative [Perkinsus marinus ATCC 50983]EER05384.1 menaquinone biosynthesis protein, putative [Perkinsus marinus ATCC 50983]|eukprot:XP_002773568.1 menaquinone biosynthesis protein, putative [Perkinsus marinus ATCC 50983]
MEAVAVDTIAEQLDCLVLADVFSGSCRRECLPSLCLSSQAVVDMLELSRPTIIRMGGALISKQVQGWMSSKMGPVKEHIRVMDVPTRRHDVDWNSTIVVDATCAEFARMVDALNVTTEALTSNRLLRDRVHAISGRIEERVHAELGDECTEPNISRALATFASSQKECVVISSSMSCRNFDTFVSTSVVSSGDLDVAIGQCPLRTNIPRSSCSRGVSGIDGTISTTIGYAVGCGLSTNLLIGDVAAIHDLNSVVQLANYLNGGGMVGEVRIPPVKIVVCNNNGGSMFKFVPIGKYSEEVAYDKNFRTPIEVAFAGAAEMMGLKGSTKVEGLSEMVECLGHNPFLSVSVELAYCQ